MKAVKMNVRVGLHADRAKLRRPVHEIEVDGIAGPNPNRRRYFLAVPKKRPPPLCVELCLQHDVRIAADADDLRNDCATR